MFTVITRRSLLHYLATVAVQYEDEIDKVKTWYGLETEAVHYLIFPESGVAEGVSLSFASRRFMTKGSNLYDLMFARLIQRLVFPYGTFYRTQISS